MYAVGAALIYLAVEKVVEPALLMGMDFGPLLSKPRLFLCGASAQAAKYQGEGL